MLASNMLSFAVVFFFQVLLLQEQT